jgi:DNA (cytosine-5)-methyltransferase 1
MARLIKEIEPKAVMMENVPGLMQRGKVLFDEFVDTLETLGYIVEYSVLQVADYGIPQNRRRLVLLAGKGFQISLPSPTHSKNGEGNLKPWRALRHAISRMPQPVTLDVAHSKGGPGLFNWHVVRNMSPHNLQRLRKTKPGSSRTCLPDNLRPACHKEREEGFSNVYGRASWDQVSPTITGGCTTFSKGRFGHPVENRTFSVREAALIQTFPKGYIFDTPYMEHVCNIVGNALPCDFAEVLAKQCINAIKAQKAKAKK